MPRIAALLILLGLAAGASEIWHPGKAVTVVADLAYGLGSAALVLLGARGVGNQGGRRRPAVAGWTLPAILAAGFGLALFGALVVLQSYPLSADEYGYNYLADTLGHGRLWNASIPTPLHDVLETVYVPDMNGKRVSQYAPGWPALLAAFGTIGLREAANPTIGLAAAGFLILALRELRAEPVVVAALTAIWALAPFTLFNNASFFNHTLSGACVLAVAWLALRDERVPSVANQLGIGLAFSILLTARYEAFVITLGLYALVGLARGRLGFVRRSLPAILGAAPVMALFLLYNWRITGSPIVTPYSWGSATLTFGLYGHGMDGDNSPARALVKTGRFATWWAEFASVAVLPFWALALRRRLGAWQVRWFDLMLPGTIAFFFFFPDGGGFQYGPRYWFIGWAALPLTIAAALPRRADWTLGARTYDPVRLAGLQLAAYAGFAVTYAVFANLQVRAHATSLRVAAGVPAPALVLVRDEHLRYVPWQVRDIPMDATSVTRNGIEGFRPVTIGLDLGEARTRRLCAEVTDRTIWTLHLEGAPPAGRLTPACDRVGE